MINGDGVFWEDGGFQFGNLNAIVGDRAVIMSEKGVVEVIPRHEILGVAPQFKWGDMVAIKGCNREHLDRHIVKVVGMKEGRRAYNVEFGVRHKTKAWIEQEFLIQIRNRKFKKGDIVSLPKF